MKLVYSSQLNGENDLGQMEDFMWSNTYESPYKASTFLPFCFVTEGSFRWMIQNSLPHCLCTSFLHWLSPTLQHKIQLQLLLLQSHCNQLRGVNNSLLQSMFKIKKKNTKVLLWVV
jgi:hypothetical protein